MNLTKHDLIARLKNAQGDMTLEAFAALVGVTKGYLSLLYNGHRDPGPAILRYLKVKAKTVEYVDAK